MNDPHSPSPENSSSALDSSNVMHHLHLDNAIDDYGYSPVENDTYFSPPSSLVVQDIDTASTSDDIYCLVCNNKLSHSTYPEFIPHRELLMNLYPMKFLLPIQPSMRLPTIPLLMMRL
jgi:hypothetical protein